MSQRCYYSKPIVDFLAQSEEEILGALALSNEFDLVPAQRDAWRSQIAILKRALNNTAGFIALEYSIPRMGSRVDAIVIVGCVVYIIEFKVGAKKYEPTAIDQACDYALDLHYFHEPSHFCLLQPILVATGAPPEDINPNVSGFLAPPVRANSDTLGVAIELISEHASGTPIEPMEWLTGTYSPTPTIVEAASALYRGHSVREISRSDAGGESLARTSDAVGRVIVQSHRHRRKSICFVTGVPGAGKTLVGLNVANQHTSPENELYSVFLSGNGPLVEVLREALARDAVRVSADRGVRKTKASSKTEIKQFIQNVHHFRDDCLADVGPPVEHVALFDEAQRAWNREQTSSFMARKKGRPDFDHSEPEFLISCLDRHHDWATIVCLVGGGQEINTGEGGIREWVAALRNFPDWHLYVAPELTGAEFDVTDLLPQFNAVGRVTYDKDLHLFASMRAFRAERVSEVVRALLDFERDGAREALAACQGRYPLYLTRSLEGAKTWLRERARGSERYGIIASSGAERLRPLAMNVRSPMDPVNWFLNGKEDVRSSYYLEEVATEFHVQGLELDWACVAWDADFRYGRSGWDQYRFRSTKWERVKQPVRQLYQKNAYRVLLTRARQGMVILVPEGEENDPTRLPEYYDGTYAYLRSLGIPELAP